MDVEYAFDYVDLDQVKIKIPYDETCYCYAGAGVTLEEATDHFTKRFGRQPKKVYHQTLPNHWPGRQPSHTFNFPVD